MRPLLLSALAALLAAGPAFARDSLVTPDTLTADEKARLQRGEPVLWAYDHDGIEGAQAMVVLPVPRPEAWALLTDYPTFADWMMSLEAITQVTSTSPTTAVVGYLLPAFTKGEVRAAPYARGPRAGVLGSRFGRSARGLGRLRLLRRRPRQDADPVLVGGRSGVLDAGLRQEALLEEGS